MLPKRFMNRQLTRWSGPIAGLLAGAYVGLGNPLASGGPPTWVTVVGGGDRCSCWLPCDGSRPFAADKEA